MIDKIRKIPEKSGLSPTQEKLIEALLQHPTIKAAALSVRINERTARNYMQEPAFSSAYAAAKQEMTAEIRGSLVALANKAIEGLLQVMDDPEAPYAVKVKIYQMALDRVIPTQSTLALIGQEPQEGVLPRDLLQYVTDEHMALIERIINDATARRDVEMRDRNDMHRL